ncbi:MAG: penicillin-insensitive murein endopeptidase, partial [Pseudomonadota bacterium]
MPKRLFRRTLFAATALLASLVTGWANAQTPAKEIFGNTPLPSAEEPRVHGFYSKGCISGAVA